MITIYLFWTWVLQLYKIARELLNVHSWLLHFSPPLSWSPLKQRISEKKLMGAGMASPRNGMLKSQNTKKVVLISKICMDSRVNQETEIFLLIPQEESSAPLHIFFIASLRTEDHTPPIHFKILPVTLVFNQSIIVVKIMSEHIWCFTDGCSYWAWLFEQDKKNPISDMVFIIIRKWDDKHSNNQKKKKVQRMIQVRGGEELNLLVTKWQ